MELQFEHVVDALEHRARVEPRRAVYTYLLDGESREQTLTYGELLEKVTALSGSIAELTRTGDRIVIMLPPCSEFFAVFWACLHAGTVPCIIYPPARVTPADLAPVAAICRDSQASLVITSRPVQQRLASLQETSPSALGIPPIHALEALEEQGLRGQRRRAEVAYLQYTSGSTSTPKGVRVLHTGLAEHLHHICERFRYSRDSVGVSWLPVHHSFGLVGAVLVPMYAGCTAISMSPAHFLERPLRWLEAIDKYRGTHAGAPNFAYDLVSSQVAAGKATRPLDLSSWHLAGCGGEAVQAGTLEHVRVELGRVGMPATALTPSYGLSEATLTVTTSPYREPVMLTLDGEALRQGRVVPCSPDVPGARTMVGVGQLLSGFEMRFVDPVTGVPTPSDVIGEVWLRGGAVADGYWSRPEETAAVFRGHLAGESAPYLRTGDLGFLWKEELFITGRCKEIIIVRGLNFFPADLEATVRHADAALENVPVAAFPWLSAAGDGLGIALELSAPTPEIVARIRARLAAEHGIESGFLTIVQPGALPRTGSGKLQRLQIAQLAQGGKLTNLSGPARAAARDEGHVAEWRLDAVRQMLGELDVSVDDSFGRDSRLDTLALTSLAIVRFSAEAKLRYGKDVPLSLLLEPGTTIAGVLACADAGHAATIASDYRRDARLADDIAAALSRQRRDGGAPAPGDILLTGATGYLGANILQRLLRQPGERKIHCLVRAKSPAEALSRLQASATSLTGSPLPASVALRVLCGDVAEPQLGLPRAEYEGLARAVGTVVHGAAHVNFAYPYEALRGANVVGTENVLRFCAEGSPKVLHFLSTAGVLATGNVGGPPRAESDAVEPEAQLLVGYEQSKWVADRIATAARLAGQATWIYRVGFVGGRSDDGTLLRTSEFFPSLIRGCVELGIYPAMDSPFAAVPVDWVADVVADKVMRTSEAPVDLHLVHPAPMSMAGCFQRVRDHGYELSPLSFEAWKAQLFATPPVKLRRTALYDYLQFMEPLHAEHLQLPSIAFSASRRMWEQYPCRDAASLFDDCIRQLRSLGMLSASKA
jgi:thioester reductase-like protein